MQDRSPSSKAMLVALVAFGGCDAPVTEVSSDPGEQDPRAFLANERDYFTVALAPSGARGEAMRAEAMLSLELPAPPITALAPDGSGVQSYPIVGTCGLTFVSPYYAITAGHCLLGLDGDDDVPVQFVTPSSRFDWPALTEVGGTYPNFTHARVTAGYGVDTMQCRIIRKCGPLGQVNPRVACDITGADIGISDTIDVAGQADIALLRCDEPGGRNHNFVDIADTVLRDAELVLPWYHEVYDVPLTTPPPSAPANERDLHEFYTVRQGHEFNTPQPNYHYIGGLARHQLLPLLSSVDEDWTIGFSDPLDIATDFAGCHGTSGSGLMQVNPTTGEPELLGNAVSGRTSVEGPSGRIEGLCHGSTELGNMTFSGLELTRHFANEALRLDCQPGAEWSSPLLYWLACDRSWLQDLAIWWWFPQLPPGCLSCPIWSRFQTITEPVAVFESLARTPLAPAKTIPGRRYRAMARVWAPNNEAVELRVGNRVVATRQFGKGDAVVDGVPHGIVSGTFVADANSSGVIAVAAVGAQQTSLLGASEVVLVEDGAPNTFASMYDRASLALYRFDPPTKAWTVESMRYTGDGEGGYRAMLGTNEIAIVNRQALAAGTRWTVELGTEENLGTGLVCGMLFEDGRGISIDCSQGTAVLDARQYGQPFAYYVINVNAKPVHFTKLAIARAD